MNKILNGILTIAAISILVFTGASCNSDEPKLSPEEKQLNLLLETWKATSVTFDGDVQNEYSNFEVTFSEGTTSDAFKYAVANSPVEYSTWPKFGNVSFGGNVLTQLIRDEGTTDELGMSYTVTESTLIIEFTFAGIGYPGGRVEALHGDWKFNFSKK